MNRFVAAVVVLMLVGPLALAQEPTKKAARAKTISLVSLITKQRRCQGDRTDILGCVFNVGLDVSFSIVMSKKTPTLVSIDKAKTATWFRLQYWPDIQCIQITAGESPPEFIERGDAAWVSMRDANVYADLGSCTAAQ
ncbi:hypothetical protein [Stigmatella erecta]|uniref:Uncharacterized protein n=1 Tax=Stigmatella erecta TaxID=83460 RepID=A0A1I0L9Z5_9BACT|nr:hypothetical protein [Stigmatella erecta]SEU36919.1 hypothetical protein SAMN05443639_12312 [Stigmatella erecta]